MMNYYLQRLRNKLDRSSFNRRCIGVFDTPAVACDPTSRVVLVSQLYHPDITMYLLAAKSFSRFVRPREVVIVDDGLTEQDKVELQKHFAALRIVRTADVNVGACPRRGCWERFLTLSEESRGNYVIQLDSDTLTLARPAEVLDCIDSDRGFTLGTSSGLDFVGVSDAARHARQFNSDHVQSVAERSLDRIENASARRYVRGCAGFAGFAPGALPRDGIERFSREMQGLVGERKWCEWGSEQVASNYMVANAPGAIVLPVHRYPFWMPGIDTRSTVFVHFFGTFRFQGGMYLDASRRIIKELGG